MDNIPTAIFSRKPLVILSVAVSLFLHTGGFAYLSSIKIPEKISARFPLNQCKEERKIEASTFIPKEENIVFKNHIFIKDCLFLFLDVKSSSSSAHLTFTSKNPTQIISFPKQKEIHHHKLTPILEKKTPSLPCISLSSLKEEKFNNSYPVVLEEGFPVNTFLSQSNLGIAVPLQKSQFISLYENPPTLFSNFDLDYFVHLEETPRCPSCCKREIYKNPLFSLDFNFIDKQNIGHPSLQKEEPVQSYIPICEYSSPISFSYDFPIIALEKSYHDYSLFDQIGGYRKEELALLESSIPSKTHLGKPNSLDLDAYLSSLLPLNQNEETQSPFQPLIEKKGVSDEVPSFFTKIDPNSSLTNDLVENYERTIAAFPSVDLASPDLQVPLDREDALAVNQSARFTQGLLAQIPHPSDLETISLNNSFETEVFYAPRYNAEGYLFAVKVKPNKKLYFETPLQNIIFILDGSDTVGRDRYNVYRDAVDRALSRMHHGDTFSIMVSDPALEILCPSPLEWNPLTVRRARSFLQSKSFKGYFYKHDIFSFLDEITPLLSDERENVVILLTDGRSLGGIKCYRNEFLELLAENSGKFSLFVAASSKDNNLLTLDFLSTFNNGALMYSPTNAAFSRKLSVLVKHVENLVAKDIHVTVAAHEENKNVEFYPNDDALPNLYSDTPYMIYGTIKKLVDFDLIIQGRAGDHWLNIEQHISFKDAEKANASTRRNFAMQQAYVCYDYFLKENDPFFLCEMDRILEPYHLSSDR